MNRTYSSHGWQYGEGWLSTGLSLKNGSAMYFVLPDEGVTPGDLLADRETLAEILAQDGDGGGARWCSRCPNSRSAIPWT